MSRLPPLLVSICLFTPAALMAGQTELESCSRYEAEVPVASEVASASILANVIKTSGSIRATSERMFDDGTERIATAAAPAELCPSHCEPAEPQMVFQVEPTRLLTEYDQAPRCERLLEATLEQPLVYEGREFGSVREFSGWWRQFAVGKGPDGEDVYRHCDGRCTPRYTSVIVQHEDHLVADTSVICGHARDRQDNRYALSYSLRWTCRDRSVGGGDPTPGSAVSGASATRATR